jgi:hypothetical protein
MRRFWQLPAPSAFVRGATEDLRSGNNVILTFPSHAPEGWFGALRSEIRQLNLHRLEIVEVNGVPPLTSLANHLGIAVAPGRLRLPDLCERHEFHGRLLYFRGDSPETWTAWRQFLSEYEDSCRALDLARRTLFVTSLHEGLCGAAPPPANLLRIHHWNGWMDGLNTRLYAATLLTGEIMHPWQRQLSVAVLSELALWDPAVCEAGVAGGLSAIFNPAKWLAELGQARGWLKTDESAGAAAECRGLRQCFEGRSRVHSAWLAVAGRTDALAHRVWNGQVAALFPLLERQRRALLRTHRGRLRVPWQTAFGRIERIEDLELNHIADQLLSQRSRGLRDVYDFVCWLRDMRNDLAHLDPIPFSRVLDGRFQDRLGQEMADEQE